MQNCAVVQPQVVAEPWHDRVPTLLRRMCLRNHRCAADEPSTACPLHDAIAHDQQDVDVDSASLVTIKRSQLHAARYGSAHIMVIAVATWSLEQPCAAAPSLKRSQFNDRTAAPCSACVARRNGITVGNRSQQSGFSGHRHLTTGVVVHVEILHLHRVVMLSWHASAARAYNPYTLRPTAHICFALLPVNTRSQLSSAVSRRPDVLPFIFAHSNRSHCCLDFGVRLAAIKSEPVLLYRLAVQQACPSGAAHRLAPVTRTPAAHHVQCVRNI
jgi:hypothetical protein